MKNLSLAVLMFVLFGGMSAFSGCGPEPMQVPKKSNDAHKELSGLMKRKLENSQKVLEGLAMNNFDKISKHAEELLSLSNEAEWKALRTPEYELFSNDFRRSAKEMIKNANLLTDEGCLACLDCCSLSTERAISCHPVTPARNIRSR